MSAVAICKSKQILAVLDVALGVGEHLDRLQGGHEDLGRAGCIHLRANDLDRLV